MRVVLLSVLLLAAPVSFAALAMSEQLPAAADLTEATAAYLRDPVGAAATFIDTARRHGGELTLLHVLLLSDAAVRTGQEAVARDLALDLRKSSVDPAMTGTLEMLLAWTALARGNLGEASARLEAASELNPTLRPVAAPALGLVASARGLRDGPATLAAAMAQPDLDPAWREIAPLLDAYARYWQGDAARAADAFTGFAVSNPNSRFADDALYAAARAKRRAGRTAEAEADLLALAGDDPAPPGISHRLVALNARALLREGVRRDRDLGHRRLAQRFADLLDGDGVALARAALGARRRGHAADRDDADAAGATSDESGRYLHGVRNGAGAGTPAATTRSRVITGDAVANHPGREATSATTGAPRAGWRWLGAAGAAALLLAAALRRIARRRPRPV